ncbi:MAG: SMI1/KNR4 family protein [Ramlibacter sp.]|jgi:hypothetical protein|nr:SMI1/KNR4 family protein [Ramlibacter sp.]
MTLDDFVRFGRAQKYFRTLGHRPPPAAVKAIEIALRTELPDSYRELVLEHGFVRWFGVSIFGIDPDEEESTVVRTLEERANLSDSQSFACMPERGNFIAEIFGGGFCFLYGNNSDRAGQVAAHAPDDEYREVQYWRSIEDYFEFVAVRSKNWVSVGAQGSDV